MLQVALYRSRMLLLCGMLAAPVIAVRGHARLDLHAVERGGDAVLVQGELRDAELLMGLAGRRVVARMDGIATVAETRTDAGGGFSLSVVLDRGATAMTVRFAGDDEYLAADAGPVSVEEAGGRIAVALAMEAPERILDNATFAISASAHGQALSLPVVLVDGSGRELGQSAKLPARLALVRQALGLPGMMRVTARFAGDAHYAAAEASVETMLVASTDVTLETDDDQGRLGTAISMSGVVRDETGPLVDELVALHVRGEVAAVVSTDAEGRFAARVDTRDRAISGRLEVFARTQPQVPWRAAGQSVPIRVEVNARPQHRAGVFWAMTLACVACLLTEIGLRRRGERRASSSPSEATAAVGLEASPASTGPRAQALARYRDAVWPYLGAAWSTYTPDETAKAIPELARMCSAFAELYFGPGPS